ncbi:WD40 repeat-containing protein [Trypanosoma grayi]|uniref:WD40 repeat-containing protein n=1 Tax=Trypanosoma grayi TaxID=71804 RepID=UPI0004F47F56|nr:WD40 repeat-containing protein [Trypanosoma grayi]KEG10332.1 WD40 repeat-containing protein [Trypanosoma grayi]
MLSCATANVYRECCATYVVKPNKDVLEQIDRPDFFTIKQIDVSRTFLGELGVRALLDFVGTHAGIQRLILVKNDVDAACVEQLCHVLRNSPSLYYVDLSENPMSTPSARLLWETARTVPTVREIKVEKCGVSEEWLHRLERCCKANDELQRLGFHYYGPERRLWAWETVFVLVLGPPHIAEKYCADILPSVGSFASRLRLRIAPLTISEEDPPDVVLNKVQRCRESRNYSLSWCVALIESQGRWRNSDLAALTTVLRQEVPVVPPLRNKLGALRDPMYKCAKHVFLYDVTRLQKTELQEGGVLTIPPTMWIPSIGLDVVDGVRLPPALALTSESSWRVCCQSELYTSLHTIFSERPRPIEIVSKEEQNDEQLEEMIERDKDLGSLHPRCKNVVEYVESAAGLASAPLILYGAGMLGKSKILSWAASTYSAAESLRVVLYRASRENPSIVAFLYRLLRVFSKSPRRSYRSVRELAVAVREAICSYEGVMVLLLVSSIDCLDSCGSRESLALEWLPSSLPPTVRLIVTLRTESPLLAVFRKRLPQPYEVLITPFPKHVRAELFLKELQRRSIGVDTTDGSSSDGRSLEPTKALEGAFLQKGGSDNTSFAAYTASFLQRLPEDLAEQDIAFLVTKEVPDTDHEILISLLKRYEALSSPSTVQYAMLSLTAAPLPISELVYICEELGPCTRHKTLPVLLLMSDDGLVTVTADSTIHLSGMDVRQAVASLYGDMQDTVSVLVETHLYRLVMTQSPDMSFCFRQLGPLMMANGSFDAANSLVLDTTIMDALLRREGENCTYVIDFIFHLINARELLIELGDSEVDSLGQSIRHLSGAALRNALKCIQSYDGFFFQSALLSSDTSPYHMRAIEATEVPYTVLVPLNRGAEDVAAHSLEFKLAPVHCHVRGEYLAVTTAQEVAVYSTSDFQKAVARSYMPFELNQNLRGALIAAGTRVVVIGDGQLLLWDFAGHSFTLLEDTASSLSENALDPFGLNLVVRHPSREHMSIIDVSKKKVASELPSVGTPVREALFCGNNILALALYDLFLIRDDEIVKLSHSAVVRGVGFSSDGRLIASCVNDDLWIWSGAGDLIHIIDAGLTPLEDLHFNMSGTLLLSWQSEGIKLWQSLTGKCIATLESCFDEEVSFACFSEDDSYIVGRCGPQICVWNSHSCQPIGAFVCSSGYFTFVQQRNEMVIAATSKNELKVWNFGDNPIPSIQTAKEKMITTMWRKSAKLSRNPIVWLDVNSTGTILAAADKDGNLILQPMSGAARLDCNITNAESMAFLGDVIVFTVKGKGSCFFYRSLNQNATIAEVPLPRDATITAVLELVTARDGGSIAVISNAEGQSVIYVYNVDDWSLTNQFIGHSGRIAWAFFAGDFLLSSSDDRTLRLWSLVKHAERTSYLHDCHIAAVTTGPSKTLFFIDNQLRLFHVHVENINSSTHAHFVVEEVELTPVIPATVKVRQATLVSDLLVMSTEDGSVYLVDLRQGGSVSRLPDYKCLYAASTCDASGTYVMTAHTTGEVVLHQVRFAE